MSDSQITIPSYPLDAIDLNKSGVSLSESDGPPSLRYDIASKKRSIAISATSIVFLNGVIPAALFYILQYGTNLSKTNVINIVEVTTTLTLVQWPWRLWQLYRRGGERAPRERTWLTWDSFQWNFLIGIIPVATCCTVAGITQSMRWYIFGPVVLFGQVAAQMVLTSFLARAKVPMPIRMSSVPAWTPSRPAVYFLIEDVTACDAGAGQEFRDRLNVRWEASPPFRKLVADLTLFLGLGLLVQTAAQVIIIVATDEKIFVALSTILLWGWCGLSALWAIPFTQRCLERERIWWAESYKKSRVSV